MFLSLPANCSGFIHVISSGTCPDYTQIYQCTVMGGVATVWKGNAFDCDSANNEIILLHRRFNSSNDNASTVSCNNGTIVGQSLRVEDNYYTSQIIVTFSSELVGTDIECSHDRGSSVTSVGNTSIFVTGVYLAIVVLIHV